MAMSKGAYFKGLEYDWESEWAVLQKHNITPRYIFPSKQWLLHAIGRGTTQGPEKLDQWMCFTRKPDDKGFFTIPLADGTTQTYQCDKKEGPFLDSYTFARVMKKYNLTSIDLWPPDTSLSEDAALQAGLRELGLSPQHSSLLTEWVARKAGKPLQEIFEGRAGGKITEANDPRLSEFSAKHIMETEAIIRMIVERTILGQASFLKQLENAFKSETNPEKQQVIKDKMLEILYSQAAVWKQLTKEQQTWILKNSPPEADYWLVIAELERIRAASEQSNWELLFKTWQPRISIDDEAERNRLKEEYQKQAMATQAADLLETKIDAGI